MYHQRNFTSQNTDKSAGYTFTSNRHQQKYHQRSGRRRFRAKNDVCPPNGNAVEELSDSMRSYLTTDSRTQHKSSSNNSETNTIHRLKQNHRFQPTGNAQKREAGWWRVTIHEAGDIGKDRVMATLKAHFTRPLLPYHYFIDPHSKDGVFFVNNQQDADMLKRISGKIEVRSLDMLRIFVTRVPAPVPSLDDDLKKHLKDYLLSKRFNQQTFQLDLSNLANDEDLTDLGIFPQFNKRAFVSIVVELINDNFNTTRHLDLGTNNLTNLHELRNLNLDNLIVLSLASNQLRDVDDFNHLNHLPQLNHIYIKNNPLLNKTSHKSVDDIISVIQRKLPQLQRIDDNNLAPVIRFPTDIVTLQLPASIPHCVPHEIGPALQKFIQEFYQSFDDPGRNGLHVHYHDQCLLSLCITKPDDGLVPVRQYKIGPLVQESRNLLVINDNRKRISLLRHGKTDVLDFLRVRFPATKHDGNSFRVDLISTVNNRAVFTINGLYTEVTTNNTNDPVRCFQRTFTCVQIANGVLIVADHIMLSNATQKQISKLTPPTVPTEQTNGNVHNQEMIQHFSQQSGMNMEFSELCLKQNDWNFEKAAENFITLQREHKIPPQAFNQL